MLPSRIARDSSYSRRQPAIPLAPLDPPSYAPYSASPTSDSTSALEPKHFDDSPTLAPSRGRPPLSELGIVSSVGTDAYAMPVSTRGRTPSPSPSEADALTRIGQSMFKFSFRGLFQRKYLTRWIVGGGLLLVVILFVVFQNAIVGALQPAANWMHSLKLGWLIPIAVMVVLSFPPLFGHELIAMLVGLVWGMGAGFGIVAAGTFLGELANFFAFKQCCKARAEKLLLGNLRYASLARAVQDGGLPIVLAARYSVVPGHLLTAVFSTCGMTVWVFCTSAVLGLGKQLAFVYMGVALEAQRDGAMSKTENIVKLVVVVGMVGITVFAMRFVQRRMDEALVKVVYERRKMRQTGELQSMSGVDLQAESVASLATTAAGTYGGADKPLAGSLHLPTVDYAP